MPSLVIETSDMPLAKRQKPNAPSGLRQHGLSKQSGSRVFAPFRTLGLVSPTHVPFTSVRLGKTTFQITTSVGHTLHTYDLSRGLRLIFLSQPRTPDLITATFAWKHFIFAAWGGLQSRRAVGVWVFKRGKLVASLEIPPRLSQPIRQLLVFGSWIIGCCDEAIHVWKLASYEHHATLTGSTSQVATEVPIFTGAICNMPTYVNKVFVGRADGHVDIWNVRSGRLLYSIPPSSPQDGPVTTLQPTPVLSNLAIAYKSGVVSINNVEFDQHILRLKASTFDPSPIVSISFRTDGIGAGEDGKDPGVMATSTVNSGDIVLWDLNHGGRKVGVLRGAHDVGCGVEGGINRVEFLDSQPILISSGGDNALRSWIFDESPFSPIPRSLHARQGHSDSVTALQFLPSPSNGADAAGKWLLSAAKDRALFALSLRKDSQNVELSQGNVRSKVNKLELGHVPRNRMASSEHLKAPEIVSIACSLNRDGGFGSRSSQPIWTNSRDISEELQAGNQWESIVTGHRGDKFARTWFWGRKRAGRWAFETGDGTAVKSVAISPCGTFAVIGSEGGCIDMYNLQSGLHRQSFPSRTIPLTSYPPSSARHSTLPIARKTHKHGPAIFEEKHNREISGLAIDSLNRMVVSSGLDGRVKFWELLSGQLISQLDWSPMTAISSLRYSPQSELLAFGCDDLSIRIVDMETKKTVRELWGCTGQINDFTFSNDGRWIIAASMDSVIRVWDLPTGHLIDAFQTESSCTALSFSENGQFLATAHAGEVGINIWTNKSLFVNIASSEISDDDIRNADISASLNELITGTMEAVYTEEDGEETQKAYVIPREQLDPEMVTLSSTPKNSWHTLLHLDTIRNRNKPKDPPKKPERAPFFLPSLHEKSLLSPSNDNVRSDSFITLQSEATETAHSRVSKLELSRNASFNSARLSYLLKKASQEDECRLVIDYLKSSSPSRVDLDIRSLDMRYIEGFCEIVEFVAVLTNILKSRRDFELVNTWMAAFLRVHGDSVREAGVSESSGPPISALKKILGKWKTEQQREAERLSRLISYCRGVMTFLRSAR